MSLNHKRVTVPSWCFTWRCLSPEKDEILKQMSICATELFILLILLLGISWQLHRTCDLSRRSRHTFEKRVKMWKIFIRKEDPAGCTCSASNIIKNAVKCAKFSFLRTQVKVSNTPSAEILTYLWLSPSKKLKQKTKSVFEKN